MSRDQEAVLPIVREASGADERYASRVEGVDGKEGCGGRGRSGHPKGENRDCLMRNMLYVGFVGFSGCFCS